MCVCMCVCVCVCVRASGCVRAGAGGGGGERRIKLLRGMIHVHTTELTSSIASHAVLVAAGHKGGMAGAATIDHTSVYVDVNNRTNETVVTSQPAKNGQGNRHGEAEYDAERAKVNLLFHTS